MNRYRLMVTGLLVATFTLSGQDYVQVIDEDFNDAAFQEVPSGWTSIAEPGHLHSKWGVVPAIEPDVFIYPTAFNVYEGQSAYCAGTNWKGVKVFNIWEYSEPKYLRDMQTRLLSPPVDPSAFWQSSSIILEFKSYIDFPALDLFYDDIQVSLLYADGSTDKLLDKGTDSDGWETFSYDLTGELENQPFQVVFAFRSGDQFLEPEDEGVYIDDVVLKYMPEPSIQITRPGAGFSFVNGSSIDVQWETNFDDPVHISLKRSNGAIIGQVYYNIANDGSYNFDIPSNSPYIPNASDWFIEIEYGTDSWRSDEFTIEPPVCNVPTTATSINYGKRLPDGNPTVIPQTFYNYGNTAANVSISRSGSSTFSVNDNSFLLAPNSSTTINFSFNPTSNGTYSATFTVNVDCQNCSSTTCGDKSWTISVSGIGDEPDVRIVQETLDYGEVYIGNGKNIDYLIRNYNPTSGITLTASTSHSTFSLNELNICNPCTEVDETAPFYLQPAGGNVAILTIRFRPVTTGPVSATLTLSGGGQVFQHGLYAIGIEKVANPTINLSATNLISGAYYSGPVTVSMVNNHSGATIRYTTDGSTPTSNSPVYSGPFTVNDGRTINAMAFKTGSYIENSNVVTKTFYVTGTVPQPQPDLLPSKYYNDLVIRFTNYDASQVIYYTLDETTPTTASAVYNHTTGISINATATLKAMATHTNWLNSQVYSGYYELEKILDPPVADPDPQDTIFYSPIDVSLASFQGAEIRYTTDGTDPGPGSSLYSGPLPLSESTGIRAICYKDTWDPSSIITYNYVMDINHLASDILLSANTIDENQSAGTLVGMLTAVDPDVEDLHVFSLIEGDSSFHNDQFYIVDNELFTSVILDYETEDTLVITIQADDYKAGPVSKVFKIMVGDLVFAPTDILMEILDASENQAPPYPVAALTAVDLDIPTGYAYTFAAGEGDTHNTLFFVTNDTLYANTGFNYEQDQDLSVRIRLTDAQDQTVEKQFSIPVEDINEPITDFYPDNNQIIENLEPGAPVGTIIVEDEDISEDYYYLLTESGGCFGLTDGGDLYTTQILNHEELDHYELEIRVKGQINDSITKTITIEVLDINDPPDSIVIAGASLPENMPPGSAIGTLSVFDQDQDDHHTLTLPDGIFDNESFMLNGFELLSGLKYNYEEKPVYQILVQATDQGGSMVTGTFEITVTDADDPMSLVPASLSIPENNEAGATIHYLKYRDEDLGMEIIDPQEHPGDYYFRVLEAPGLVSIDSVTGIITASGAFNYEERGSWLIRLALADLTTTYDTADYTLSILDRDDPVTGLQMTGLSVAEHAPTGTLTGQLIVEDEDAEGSYTYELITGGDLFVIDQEGRLHTGAVLNHESAAEHLIELKVTGDSGEEVTGSFTVTVTDVNDDPSGILADNLTIPENRPSGTLIATLSAIDEDLEDHHTFSLPDQTLDNQLFQVSGHQLLSGSVYNHEHNDQLKVCLETTDQAGVVFRDTFLIAISDEDDPSTLLPKNLYIYENNDPGDKIGNLLIEDEDLEETLFAGNQNDTLTHTFSNNSNMALDRVYIEQLSPLGVAGIEETTLTSNMLQSVCLNIRHSFTADLHIELVSPSGTRLVLVSREGSSSDNFINTCFTAGSTTSIVGQTGPFTGEFIPEGGSLEVFNGEDPNGTWQLSVTDKTSGDAGTLLGWSLTFREVRRYQDFSGIGVSFTSTVPVSEAWVDPQTGIVTAGRSFDHETGVSFGMDVVLYMDDVPCDSAHYKITVLNVNEPPGVTAMVFTLQENSEAGTYAGTISGTDPEHDELTYKISGGSAAGAFSLDSVTGNVTVAVPEQLDYELAHELLLEVEVSDGVNTSPVTAIIALTDMDEPPVFGNTTLSIEENIDQGSSIGILPAWDPEGQSLAILEVSGTGRDVVSVDQVSGVITVSDPAGFDHESTPVYSLRVTVSDNTFQTTGDITIEVLDINEAPVCRDAQLSLMENTPEGTVITMLQAEDPDEGQDIGFSITGGNDGQPFGINSVTGEIFVQQSGPLDFETNPVINLVITLTDNGDPPMSCEAGLEVTLIDSLETGMDGFMAGQFSIYPNPAESHLYISQTGPVDRTVMIRITDLSGKVLFMEPLETALEESHALDISGLTCGLYLIEFQSDQEIYRYKFIKM